MFGWGPGWTECISMHYVNNWKFSFKLENLSFDNRFAILYVILMFWGGEQVHMIILHLYACSVLSPRGSSLFWKHCKLIWNYRCSTSSVFTLHGLTFADNWVVAFVTLEPGAGSFTNGKHSSHYLRWRDTSQMQRDSHIYDICGSIALVFVISVLQLGISQLQTLSSFYTIYQPQSL